MKEMAPNATKDGGCTSSFSTGVSDQSAGKRKGRASGVAKAAQFFFHRRQQMGGGLQMRGMETVDVTEQIAKLFNRRRRG